jgi:hypothetical protein
MTRSPAGVPLPPRLPAPARRQATSLTQPVGHAPRSFVSRSVNAIEVYCRASVWCTSPARSATPSRADLIMLQLAISRRYELTGLPAWLWL